MPFRERLVNRRVHSGTSYQFETFLYEVLNYPIDEIYDEADRLEHFISESFEMHIADKPENPQIDPPGHCIPAFDGFMPAIHRVICNCE